MNKQARDAVLRKRSLRKKFNLPDALSGQGLPLEMEMAMEMERERFANILRMGEYARKFDKRIFG